MRTLLIAITLAATSSAMASVQVPDSGAPSLMLVAAVSSLILGRALLRRR
jgi:hypothetical protein